MQHKMLRALSTLMILSILFSFPAAGNSPKPPVIIPLKDDITVTTIASQTSDKPEPMVLRLDEHFNPNVKQETPLQGLTPTAHTNDIKSEIPEAQVILPASIVELGESRLEKTVDTHQVLPGDTAHYTISLINDAPQMTEFVVRDSLPENATYRTESATDGLVYVEENHELLGTIELQAEGMSIVTEALYGYIPLSQYTDPEPCPVGDCDEATISLSGFDFYFYGKPVSDLVWSTNGFLRASSEISNLSTTNQNLPDPTAPNNLVAPLWTDLDLNGCSLPSLEGAWYRLFASVEDIPYYIFEWENAALKNDSTACFTFQVWIKTGTDEIWFVYGPQTSTIDTATVGIENQDGSLGDTYYYNNETGSAPVEGNSLKVVRNESQAIFEYDLLIKADLGEHVINLVEATNTGEGTVMQASTIVQVGERTYLPIALR